MYIVFLSHSFLRCTLPLPYSQIPLITECISSRSLILPCRTSNLVTMFSADSLKIGVFHWCYLTVKCSLLIFHLLIWNKILKCGYKILLCYVIKHLSNYSFCKPICNELRDGWYPARYLIVQQMKTYCFCLRKMSVFS